MRVRARISFRVKARFRIWVVTRFRVRGWVRVMASLKVTLKITFSSLLLSSVSSLRSYFAVW